MQCPAKRQTARGGRKLSASETWGGGEAFYIHSDSWFGGETQELQMGKIPYLQKIAYKEVFFRNHGKIPSWALPAAKWTAEHLTKL